MALASTMPDLSHSSATLQLWNLEIHMIKIFIDLLRKVSDYVYNFAQCLANSKCSRTVTVIIIITNSEAVELHCL